MNSACHETEEYMTLHLLWKQLPQILVIEVNVHPEVCNTMQCGLDDTPHNQIQVQTH